MQGITLSSSSHPNFTKEFASPQIFTFSPHFWQEWPEQLQKIFVCLIADVEVGLFIVHFMAHYSHWALCVLSFYILAAFFLFSPVLFPNVHGSAFVKHMCCLVCKHFLNKESPLL